MDNRNYSIIFAKIFLYLNRVSFMTFGGVSIRRIDWNANYCFERRKLNLGFYEVSQSEIWRRLGFVVLSFVYFSAFYSLFLTVLFFHQHREEVISDTIYFIATLFIRIGYLSGYFISHFYGNRIFTFLSCHWLTKNQFRICFILLVMTLTTAFANHYIFSLAFNCNEFHSNSDLLLYQTSSLWINIPLALSTCSQISITLIAYFSLIDIIRNLENTENIDVCCKKFNDLKTRLLEMNSIFSVFNLATLSFIICMILANLANLMKNHSMPARGLELTFYIIGLTFFCFLHGLPHNASVDLVNKFDTLIAKKPDLPHSLQTFWILSRDTIGFELLGFKCHENLLSSVSIIYYLLISIYILVIFCLTEIDFIDFSLRFVLHRDFDANPKRLLNSWRKRNSLMEFYLKTFLTPLVNLKNMFN